MQPDDITLGALLDACMAENDQTVASEISELFLTLGDSAMIVLSMFKP